MAWIKGRSPGDFRWYLIFLRNRDGSQEIFPAIADPSAKGHWSRSDYPMEDRWEDQDGLVTHYHKIEPWPDPPREVEGE